MGGGRRKLGKLALWSLKYGSKLDWFLALEAEGEDVPALREMPSIVGLEWIWTAYMDLRTCRDVGMAVGPIPWWAIEMYKERKGYSWEEGSLMEYCLEAIERKLSKYQEKKDKKEKERRKKEQASDPKPRHRMR